MEISYQYDDSTFLFGIMELYSGSILNIIWYNIYVHSLNGTQTVFSKENCPSTIRVRVGVSFRGEEEGGGIFLEVNFPRTSLNIQKTNGRTH